MISPIVSRAFGQVSLLAKLLRRVIKVRFLVVGIVLATVSGGLLPATARASTLATAAPAITAILPASGPVAGGTTVTITGAAFTGATKVVFGADAATSFTVKSATEITAVSPAQSPCADNIRVTTPGGTSPVASADKFT